METITLPRQMGLSRRELARRAGVSERLVLSPELGDAPGIQLNKLMAITQVLGMRLFVELTGEPTSPGLDAASERGHEPAAHDDQAGEASTPDDPLARYRQLYDEVAGTTAEGEEP